MTFKIYVLFISLKERERMKDLKFTFKYHDIKLLLTLILGLKIIDWSVFQTGSEQLSSQSDKSLKFITFIMQSAKIACFWIMFPIMIKYDGETACSELPIPTKLSKLGHYTFFVKKLSKNICWTKNIVFDARFKNVNLTIKHLTKDLIPSMLTMDLLFFHFMSDRAKNNLRKETIGNWTRLDYRLLFYGYHSIAAMICNQLSELHDF